MTAARRKALGKGMDAIFPGASLEEGKNVREVPVEDVEPNPYQPRKDWDEGELASLAASIRRYGILQPLVVRKKDGKYQLIAGERRLRASKKAGLKRVPVLVKEADDRQMLALALVENVQRKDLDPVEKAMAFRQLAEEFQLTQEEMAAMLNMGRPTIANFIRLLDLPEKVLALLRSGELSMGHGRALLSLEDRVMMERMAVQTAKRRLSVRELEAMVRAAVEGRKNRRNRRDAAVSPEVGTLQEELQRILKTKVRIKGKGSSGRIEITYHDLDELDRILELMRAAGNKTG